MAAVGDTTIKDRLLKGAEVGNKTFKVHLDGYNQLPLLTGQTDKSARDEYYYFDDDGRARTCAMTRCCQARPSRLRGKSFANSARREDCRSG